MRISYKKPGEYIFYKIVVTILMDEAEVDNLSATRAIFDNIKFRRVNLAQFATTSLF